MKPSYQSWQPQRSLRGRGYHGISGSHRPIGRGRSVMSSQHVLRNKNTFNISSSNLVQKKTSFVPKGNVKKWKPKSRTSIIVPKNYPFVVMTDEQLDLLEIAILDAIDKMDEGKQDKRPQFISYKKINGTFTIVCYNLRGSLWLKFTLKNLEPWEDAQLKIIKPGNEFAMIILPKSYPKYLLSSEELTVLENEILSAIDRIPPESFVPKFISYEKKYCSLKINGFNIESIQWLKTTLENLSWNGPEVRMYNVDDIPVIFKIQLIIPGAPVEKELVMERLARQNNGINFSDWQFFSESVFNNNLILQMLIKQADREALGKADMKLFYMFEQIKINRIRYFQPARPASTNDNDHSDLTVAAEGVQPISDELSDVCNNSPADKSGDDVIIIDDIGDLSALLEKVDDTENNIEEQESDQEK